MKTQMRFQKILMIVTLVIGALGLVFALAFCSGAFNQLCRLTNRNIGGLLSFHSVVQSANDKLFTIGIVYVVICVVPFIAACQKRRKYYITNYIAIGIVVIFQIIFVILVIIYLSQVMQSYNSVDLAAAESRYNTLNFVAQYGEFSTKPWTPIFGYVVIGLTVVDMVLLVLNTVWKTLLMLGEKKLLSHSKPMQSEEIDADSSAAVSEVI